MHQVNRIKILIIALCACVSCIQAEEYDRFSFSLEGGVSSNDTWNIVPTMTYKPIQYIGLSGGLKITGFWKKDGSSYSGLYSDGLWRILNKNNFSYHVSFQPAIRIYSPNIKIGDAADCIYLSFGYGAIVPFAKQGKGYVDFLRKNDGLAVFDHREKIKNRSDDYNIYQFFDLSCFIKDGKWSLGIGYRIDDFDVYGCSRHLYIENDRVDFPKNKINSEVYISIIYSLIQKTR